MEQIELPLEDWGEAPSAERSGEAMSAAPGYERSGLDARFLMDRVVEGGNLRRALKRVQQNEGSPGVDGLTVDERPAFLKQHWTTIREEWLMGRYQPSVVKRVELPKPDGGVRKLGIPTVLDRFIQQAVLQVLQPTIDPTFSASSSGLRPGRRAPDAVCQAQRSVQSGRRWVVDVDLEQFFDRVHHDILRGLVAKRIADPRIRTLIHRYRRAGIMANGVVVDRHEGTPQGGPKAARYRRYWRTYCSMWSTRSWSDADTAKSAGAPAWQRSFLGYSFWVAPGKIVKRRVAPQALEKMKERVRELTSRSGGRGIAQGVALLRSYLTGWKAYFRLADTPNVFANVEKWRHRRLRALMLKQWKRGRTRYRELQRRGVSGAALWIAARFGRSWWHVAAHKALHIALPGRSFESLGLPRLAPS